MAKLSVDGKPSRVWILSVGQVFNKFLGLVREVILASLLKVSSVGSLFFSIKGSSDLLMTFLHPNSVVGLLVGRDANLDRSPDLRTFAPIAFVISGAGFLIGVIIAAANNAYMLIGPYAMVLAPLILSINLYLLIFYSLYLAVLQLRKQYTEMAGLGVGTALTLVLILSFLPNHPNLITLSCAYLAPMVFGVLISGKIVHGDWRLPPPPILVRGASFLSFQELLKVILGSLPILWIGSTKALLGSNIENSYFNYSIILTFAMNSLLLEPVAISFSSNWFSGEGLERKRMYSDSLIRIAGLGLIGWIAISSGSILFLEKIFGIIKIDRADSLQVVKLTSMLGGILPLMGISQVYNARKILSAEIPSSLRNLVAIAGIGAWIIVLNIRGVVGIAVSGYFFFGLLAIPGILTFFKDRKGWISD